jgi:SAM-dependent methyltransferase
MYRACPDPWRIEELGARVDMRAAVALLGAFPKDLPQARVLDAGAGTGLFASLVIDCLMEFYPHSLHYALADVSPTALSRARARFEAPDKKRLLPCLQFAALDLRALTPANSPWPLGSLDLIVLAQTLWGLLENLDSTLASLASLLAPGGHFLVSQHFPGEKQRYGRDIVRSPRDLQKRLRAAGLTPLHSVHVDPETNWHWGSLWNRPS